MLKNVVNTQINMKNTLKKVYIKNNVLKTLKSIC